MRTATSLSTTNPIWNHHWQVGVRIVLQQSLRLQLTQQNPLSEAPDLVMLSEVGYLLAARSGRRPLKGRAVGVDRRPVHRLVA